MHDKPKEPPLILKKFPFWVAAPVAGWAMLFPAQSLNVPPPRAPVPVHGSGREGWDPDEDTFDGEGSA